MARRKKNKKERSQETLAQHYEIETRMYLQGYTQAKIGEHLGIHHATVSTDLKTVREMWRNSAMINMNEMLNRELTRIDVIEHEAWGEWRRSKDSFKKATKRKDKDGASDSVTIEERTGNPAYLKTIQWCVEQRLKIFGLYEQPNAGDPGASINRAFLDAVREKVRVIEQETQAEMVAEYPALLDYVEGSLVDDSRN